MNSTKLKDYAEIGSIAIAVLGSLGIGTFDNVYFRIIIAVALLIVAAIFILRYIKRKKQEKLMSNVGLTKEANRVCRKIDNLIKANIKSLNKYSDFSKEKIDKDDMKNIFLKLNNQCVNKSIEEMKNERIEICDYMINTVLDMDRILLLSEQYDYRIKFGKFIAEYSHSELQKQKAYVDFIGWTYVIMGRNKLAEKSINEGIECIDEYLKVTPLLEDKQRYDALLKKVRAYRHLGSNPNVYVKKPLDCLHYLNEGLKIMNEPDFRLYYENNDLNKFIEMEVGLQYGVAICNLYLYKNKNRGLTDKKEIIKYLQESINLVKEYKDSAKNFSNKHRYVKFLLLENGIYSELKKLDEEIKSLLDVSKIDFNENVKDIEKFLNTSVYADEGMIFYLEQKLDSIVEKVNSILE